MPRRSRPGRTTTASHHRAASRLPSRHAPSPGRTTARSHRFEVFKIQPSTNTGPPLPHYAEQPSPPLPPGREGDCQAPKRRSACPPPGGSALVLPVRHQRYP
ncbi:hypothetical protein C6N75_03030 [Streptomyces solincola]|uniref:Uncharacterized protein n=1 Tax=Streptomyces solincola TaxID=2100817 RepID=A0A2S9Q1W3_9ACTN|nr:hypothetical protein C6N75_03030 [Streptomyces solincola]